jgi:hypothetical protein
MTPNPAIIVSHFAPESIINDVATIDGNNITFAARISSYDIISCYDINYGCIVQFYILSFELDYSKKKLYI